MDGVATGAQGCSHARIFACRVCARHRAGTLPEGSVGPDDIAGYLDSLGGLSAASRAHHISVVRAFLRFGQRQGAITTTLLADGRPLHGGGRDDCERAHATHPLGFAAAVEEALAASVGCHRGLLVKLVRDGWHVAAEKIAAAAPAAPDEHALLRRRMAEQETDT